MSILKDKIAKAMKSGSTKTLPDLLTDSLPPIKEETQPKPSKGDGRRNKRRPREPGSYVTSERDRSTKNIVKNYGKAICSFACSDIGKPYLQSVLEKNKIQQKQKEFIAYICKVKESIDSIQSFRSLLLITENDPEDMIAYKKAFAAIGEIFIKYFSVNWIYSGRITHKDTHLKFRFKMLRRIQNPEFFTYLKQVHQRNF